MWRRTERASLEKKPSTRLSQEPCSGVKVKFETADRLTGEPSLCLLGDVRGMIVEDQLDRRMGRIGGVEKLEKFDEFAAAVAVLDQGVNPAGEQVDPSQQTDRAVALILMIAREGGVLAGLGRQVRGRGRDRLDTGLLVIGDDRHRIARLLFCGGRRLLDELHLAIDAQNLRHLLLELRVAAFQVIANLVRLYLSRIEDVAQRALSQLGKAGMPLRRPVLACVAGEKSCRPQFVRIAEVLGLAAGEIRNPCLGLGGDLRLPAGPRQIVERRQRTTDRRPLNAALNSLMMHPHGPPHRKKRWVLPGGHSIRARSTRMADSIRDRVIARNAAKSSSPSANSIARRRPAIAFILVSESNGKATSEVTKNESYAHDWFHGIDEVVSRSAAARPSSMFQHHAASIGSETGPHGLDRMTLRIAGMRLGATLIEAKCEIEPVAKETSVLNPVRVFLLMIFFSIGAGSIPRPGRWEAGGRLFGR